MITKGIVVTETSQRGRELTRCTENGLGMEVEGITIVYLQL